jgi:membrane associated rhomboid family serine protease
MDAIVPPASAHGSEPPPGSARPPGITAIGPYGTERALKEAALVLSSLSIPFGVSYGAGGGHLVVRDADYERARINLDRYEEENRDFPPRRAVERARYTGLPLLPLAFLALVAFMVVTGPAQRPQGAWLREGASVASLVLGAEPFRAVTALTLHADGEHVLGNLLSGVLFGHAVERRLGPGGAALSVVLSGALGNVMNAAFYLARGEPHVSIGASTAVFGAVGVLATTQLFLGKRHILTPGASAAGSPSGRRHWTELAAPVVGALALLGTLGASPTSDIFAHLFGLLAGLFVAVPFALLARRSRSAGTWSQLATGALAASLVVGSWTLALR